MNERQKVSCLHGTYKVTGERKHQTIAVPSPQGRLSESEAGRNSLKESRGVHEERKCRVRCVPHRAITPGGEGLWPWGREGDALWANVEAGGEEWCWEGVRGQIPRGLRSHVKSYKSIYITYLGLKYCSLCFTEM